MHKRQRHFAQQVGKKRLKIILNKILRKWPALEQKTVRRLSEFIKFSLGLTDNTFLTGGGTQ